MFQSLIVRVSSPDWHRISVRRWLFKILPKVLEADQGNVHVITLVCLFHFRSASKLNMVRKFWDEIGQAFNKKMFVQNFKTLLHSKVFTVLFYLIPHFCSLLNPTSLILAPVHIARLLCFRFLDCPPRKQVDKK
jgi:hypothetical protein